MVASRCCFSMPYAFIYILVGGVFLECAAKSVEDSQNSENVIKDSTTEFLESYGETMKSYMNLSVSPCDDFYEYACGNWKNVRPDRMKTSHKRSNLLDLVYILSNVTEVILTRTQLAEALNVSAELLVAQRFYNACLAAVVFPFPVADPAYLATIRSMGGFPAVDGDSWNASAFSWFNMSARLTNYGVQGLINENILPQYPFQPYFKLPELGFDHIVHTENIANESSRAYKLNEERMRTYLQAFNLTEERISTVIGGVFDFWRDALAIADQFGGDVENCTFLSMENNVTQYQNWKSFYEIAWKGMDFYNGSYFGEFCDYYYVELEKVCAKHVEAVANYLSMLLLYNFDGKLKETKYHKEHCLIKVQFSLPHVINKLYMAEHFINGTHEEVAEIVKELRQAHRQVLENAEWLDAETRREAQLKESTLIPVIGSFKNDELSDRLIREIGTLELVDDSFTQSQINLKLLATRLKRFNGLHHLELANDTKPLELLQGMQVNAFYYNLDNSIYVMAGILHPPAYHRSWPNSLKFGTLGYLVGHELTHGFDTVGSSFDSAGQIRNWWSKKSEAVYAERTKCFVDHYNRYVIPEINRKINGQETQNENIADLGGLVEALTAYRSHMKQLKRSGDGGNEAEGLRSEQMPGLDLSPEQLFFLGFAQLWCADYKEEHYWEELNEEHTINKYRVQGVVSNSDDFAQIYNCPVGSAMHPSGPRCRIW
ncbi:hypothetical protein KR018_004262 [Drosophila ironensis]|nr:hypothetical protein KR018_004262 [Drosophila ironensis]